MKKQVLLTSLVCLLAITTFGQRFGKTLKDTPGMVSYTMRNEFAKDMPGTLDKIKAMGISNMEFSSLFGKTAAEIRAELDKRGMKCSSHGVGYDDLMNKMDMVVQNAKTLGAKYVRLGSVPHKGTYTLEAAQKTVSDFNLIGRQLKDKGLVFVYHNHGFEFEPYENGTLFDYIVQKTDPEAVSFEMDVLWVYFPGQDPAKLLLKYPKRFKLMHMKDVKKGVQGNRSGGTPPENDVALGTGQINLPEILKAAQKTAIEFFYIEDESPTAQQQVPQSMAYLKTI
ncbi:sugar phosphate isomerase/epimerase family protein [Larkinella humicola]|uniref:Sugar phosphate isomerase/epimerase n=1 Tax=Larkinella humicola TaxID=2607654 RepID=A0A5N1JQ00_9BACT|nr:sugar phosphate isomerase/epimerase [Larkinella humicola]KAA9356372.1 sugar phosphate isomerase/epimerase [Larkinella humicola]